MRAMVLHRSRSPLVETTLRDPEPAAGQVLVRVETCGVCRTDLHVVDGELADPKLPLILGHQVVGEVVASGPGEARFEPGERVGIPWLGWTCGECRYCARGRENLCPQARFTGYHLDGGYAELAVADQRFCLPLPGSPPASALAPLLCAGLIGFRALRMCGEAESVGLYGFGASAHIVCQVAVHEGRRVFALTRPGDSDGQEFARRLGAEWAGDSQQGPPEPLDAAIVFAPVGALVPAALRAVGPGGTVVCAGIHMSDIPGFAYADLWMERSIRSVANLTRGDGEEFLPLASQIPVETSVRTYPLARAGEALADLRAGSLRGSAVLEI
ncbi:MAG: zinc-dependent alcohol dehydrogenase family protein [Solirubrobacterales bacterium]